MTIVDVGRRFHRLSADGAEQLAQAHQYVYRPERVMPERVRRRALRSLGRRDVGGASDVFDPNPADIIEHGQPEHSAVTPATCHRTLAALESRLQVTDPLYTRYGSLPVSAASVSEPPRVLRRPQACKSGIGSTRFAQQRLARMVIEAVGLDDVAAHALDAAVARLLEELQERGARLGGRYRGHGGRRGSASRGDPLYRAGTILGRLERSLFLCDMLTNPDFRRTLHRDLSHGEAVHSLQRAIHRGALGARRGRRVEEMAAISGSLTLLTSIVMAWNTPWLQRCLEEALAGRGPAPVEHVTRMAPIGHQHIDIDGELRFALAKEDARLFARTGTYGM